MNYFFELSVVKWEISTNMMASIQLNQILNTAANENVLFIKTRKTLRIAVTKPSECTECTECESGFRRDQPMLFECTHSQLVCASKSILP